MRAPMLNLVAGSRVTQVSDAEAHKHPREVSRPGIPRPEAHHVRLTRVALALTLALALLGIPAHAQDCDPSTSTDAHAISDGNSTHYVVTDPSTCGGCPIGVHMYLYEETNGMDGLQRDDARRDDTCNGLIEPDDQVAPQ